MNRGPVDSHSGSESGDAQSARVVAPGPQPYWLAAGTAAASHALDAATRRLVPLFDGHSDAVRRLERARALDPALDAAALHEAAIDLTLAGLLQPGREEPLPAPAQLERDPWGRTIKGPRRAAVPMPTTVAGTLARPGLPGAIAGNFGGRHRGSVARVEQELPPGPFSALGGLFAWVAASRAAGFTVLALVIAGLVGFWNLRYEVARDALHLFHLQRAVPVFAIAALLINLVGQSARLAAIRHATGRWPGFGLVFVLGFLPRLFTHTGGPAELADDRGRAHILLAPVGALLLLVALAQFGWFLTRHEASTLPPFFVGLTTAALLNLITIANPLARRDGYHWLADRLGYPDLREQAWMSLVGTKRPWNERALPPMQLRLGYALLSLLYIVMMVTLYLLFPAHWLEDRFGGTGVVLFASMFGFSMYRISRRSLYRRDSMEPLSVKLLQILKYPSTFSRTTWIVLAVIAVLCVLPYPYEPSGKAVLLPHDRAEVRALVAGDVQQVLVQEGQMVEANQPLLRISDVAAKARVAAAEATLKRARAELAIVSTGGASNEVQLAREKLATARKRLALAQTEAERLASAYRRKAVTSQDYDTARGTADIRRQEVAEAEQQVKVIGNPARDERIAALQAEVVKAQTELDYNRQQLANTTLRAPIAGRVVSDKLLFARGSYLEVGAAVAYVEDTSRLQAELEMPEATVGKVALNAEARVRVWAFPGTSFRGHVTSIAPDAEQGEYGKVVRVRVLVDEADDRLKPEMTGQGKVHSHWTLAGIAFTHALVRFVLVEVWSWLP